MPGPNSCFVVELDPNRAQVGKIQKLNPDGVEGMPCVFVALLTGGHPSVVYPGDDFSSAPAGHRELKNHGLGLHSEFNQRYDGRKVGLNKQRKRVDELRELGWWVANPRPRKTYSVYVIELDPAVRDRPAAKKANPHADPTMPCVYVGQTSKSPEERLAQHLAGYRCSKWARDYGLRLLPHLYQRHNPLTELGSLWKEDSVTKALRAKGYTVMGGH
jgi:hypothetical protein